MFTRAVRLQQGNFVYLEVFGCLADAGRNHRAARCKGQRMDCLLQHVKPAALLVQQDDGKGGDAFSPAGKTHALGGGRLDIDLPDAHLQVCTDVRTHGIDM